MRKQRSIDRKDPLVVATSGRAFPLFLGSLAFLLFLLGSSPASLPESGPARGGFGDSSPGLAGEGEAPGIPDRGLYYSAYEVRRGDTVGDIAERFGSSVDGIVSFNDIQNTRTLRAGQILKIPSQAGILYRAAAGESLAAIAERHEVSVDGIIEANGLFHETLPAAATLFLPDARLPSLKLREINGDLFRWPVRGWVTSRYGWREDPFSASRSFHAAIDIGANRGTPVGAAMEGRVVETGYSATLGNYVLMAHHSGWSSIYGHLNSVAVRRGQYVGLGGTIGAVGNTGYSTGPHLHFGVFKNGRSMNPSIVLH